MGRILNIMYIPGAEELVIFIFAMIGALIGFLWYNAYPAQIFMGDTGSLTIGGFDRRFGHHYPQRAPSPAPLLHLLCRKSERNLASRIFQILQAQRLEA